MTTLLQLSRRKATIIAGLVFVCWAHTAGFDNVHSKYYSSIEEEGDIKLWTEVV